MLQEDKVQVAVFNARPTSPDNNGIAVEMGGGEGNLIRILGCHYGIELISVGPEHDILIQMALSSNPEHEGVGAGAFDEFIANKALYAKATLQSNHDGIGDSTATRWNQVIPVYGLVRPRRQIFVWSVLNGSATTGLWLEVYYTPFSAPFTEREEVNRKYGKYRRT